MEKHQRGQLRHIVDEHVIAPLLAFPEDQNRAALRRLPAEAVGTIAVVRIGGAVNQRGAQHRHRRVSRALQHQLPGCMHHPVDRRGSDVRALRHGIGIIGVYGIRADIDKMGNLCL